MEHKILSSTGSDRLVLIYAGWGMDSSPFEGIHRAGYDVAVVWDYSSMAIDWSFTRQYKEICIVAWSFGVYASAVSCHGIEPKVTRRIAVNGTLYPCDRRLGIPPAIFDGTLSGLSERNIAKFYRRMCGSADAYAGFMRHAPNRALDSLRDELEAFSPDATLLYEPIRRFDIAIIGRDDAIIPAVNQWRAWQGTPTLVIDGPHMLDLQVIIDHFIVDKQRVGSRFATGLQSYDSNADVQAAIVDEIGEMLTAKGIDRRLGMSGCRVLEIGSGTGSLSRVLDAAVTDGYIEMWDLAGKACVEGPNRRFRRTDAEVEIASVPSMSCDVIATASTVQWFNSPGRFMAQCARALVSGGYLVLSSFVKGNLEEVSRATGRCLPLMTLAQWKQSIPPQFETVDIVSRDMVVDFDSAIDVFRHLKATGVNALGRDSGGETSLHHILRNYHPGLDGRYHITYRPFIMILKKK